MDGLGVEATGMPCAPCGNSPLGSARRLR